MTEDYTYIRAKLTEINSSLSRMTEMLNKMVETLTGFVGINEKLSDLALAVAANGEKLEELSEAIRSLPQKGIGAAATIKPTSTIEEKALAATLGAVLDTLEAQVREGIIASDLAKKIKDAAEMFEEKGGPANLTVKMQRWVRILKTYGRVDPINPADLSKLRNDIRDWQREVAQLR